ncbi:hypothetical protein [Arsenicibacter rosenii]|uniref:Uncharacterized protein n=1 Tax=Arsenicibacter rosenii TaxID=1750698 RepID=A0A1S2VAE9_9BACT|nr:hypothetical protein [Arsenicibacter rosenii]OIN55629.1 hypothetical protein BLX24_29025 [Arsenicibacter rosenii]
MRILNHQQVIDDLTELEKLGRQLAHTFVNPIAHNEMDEEQVKLLIQGVNEIAFLAKSVQISIQP